VVVLASCMGTLKGRPYKSKSTDPSKLRVSKSVCAT